MNFVTAENFKTREHGSINSIPRFEHFCTIQDTLFVERILDTALSTANICLQNADFRPQLSWNKYILWNLVQKMNEVSWVAN